MKKSERFQKISDIQAQQEWQALQSLGACQQKQQVLETQLQNLQRYRREYAAKYDVFENHRVSVGQLVEFRAFIEKIDRAIEAQRQTVEKNSDELLQVRRSWEQKHRKTVNLQKISERAAREEMRLVDKLEQADHDERACRAVRKNGIGTA